MSRDPRLEHLNDEQLEELIKEYYSGNSSVSELLKKYAIDVNPKDTSSRCICKDKGVSYR